MIKRIMKWLVLKIIYKLLVIHILNLIIIKINVISMQCTLLFFHVMVLVWGRRLLISRMTLLVNCLLNVTLNNGWYIWVWVLLHYLYCTLTTIILNFDTRSSLQQFDDSFSLSKGYCSQQRGLTSLISIIKFNDYWALRIHINIWLT